MRVWRFGVNVEAWAPTKGESRERGADEIVSRLSRDASEVRARRRRGADEVVPRCE